MVSQGRRPMRCRSTRRKTAVRTDPRGAVTAVIEELCASRGRATSSPESTSRVCEKRTRTGAPRSERSRHGTRKGPRREIQRAGGVEPDDDRFCRRDWERPGTYELVGKPRLGRFTARRFRGEKFSNWTTLQTHTLCGASAEACSLAVRAGVQEAEGVVSRHKSAVS